MQFILISLHLLPFPSILIFLLYHSHYSHCGFLFIISFLIRYSVFVSISFHSFLFPHSYFTIFRTVYFLYIFNHLRIDKNISSPTWNTNNLFPFDFRVSLSLSLSLSIDPFSTHRETDSSGLTVRSNRESFFPVVLEVQRVPAEARVPGPTDRDAGIDRFVARGSGPRGSSKEAQRREARLPERKPNRWPRLRIGASEKPRTQKALGRVAGQFEGARKGKAGILGSRIVCFSTETEKQKPRFPTSCAHRIHFDSRLGELRGVWLRSRKLIYDFLRFLIKG